MFKWLLAGSLSNRLLVLIASLVLASLGWWRRDYRVPLLVHVALNTLGHVLFLASLGMRHVEARLRRGHR